MRERERERLTLYPLVHPPKYLEWPWARLYWVLKPGAWTQSKSPVWVAGTPISEPSLRLAARIHFSLESGRAGY